VIAFIDTSLPPDLAYKLPTGKNVLDLSDHRLPVHCTLIFSRLYEPLKTMKEVDEMLKTNKMLDRDLKFVRKYCLGGSYPASDERCPYAKAKMWSNFLRGGTRTVEPEEVDAMFLCRYPDKEMPLHEARLISELNQCPDMERKNQFDALECESTPFPIRQKSRADLSPCRSVRGLIAPATSYADALRDAPVSVA
jgi:hypothetical protein